MFRKSIIFLLGFLLVSCSTQAVFNIRLWEKGDASNDKRVLSVEEHPFCSGNVVLIKTTRMPRPYEGPFEGEKVIELSENNKVLKTWYMPVDYIVLGVEGSHVITGFGDSRIALKIREDGTLNNVPAPKFEALPTDCPEAAKDEFPESDYLRCFIYHDRRTGQKRVLSYEGPCT